MNLKTIPGELLAGCLELGGAAREDRDLGAGLGKPPRHRDADAFAAAGDDGHAILHRDLHPIVLIVEISSSAPPAIHPAAPTSSCGRRRTGSRCGRSALLRPTPCRPWRGSGPTVMVAAVPIRLSPETLAECRADVSSAINEPMEWPTRRAFGLPAASSRAAVQSARSAMVGSALPAERP